MNVKIDTKEKFTVITPIDSYLPANMTDELVDLLHSYSQKPVPHVVLNLENVTSMDDGSGGKMADLQSGFYAENKSIVFCKVAPQLIEEWEKEEVVDGLNIVPTESEAWDILQMEEVERELLSGLDDDASHSH